MDETPTPTIELYVRSLLPAGAPARQEAVIERLEDLSARGHIEDFSVIVWGRRIDRSTAAARTAEGEYILNRVAEFKSWALGNNVSLESFYDTQEVQSEVTDDAYTAITLPVMGLAEYHDGELRHVAPCTDDDVVHTIVDRLDQLEAGRPPAVASNADTARVI